MISLDIETKCAKPGCMDTQCSHALIPHHAQITVSAIAMRNPQTNQIYTRVFRDLRHLSGFLFYDNPGVPLTGHNFKFDMKMLRHHGVDIPLSRYAADSALMATASYEKVSPEYLEWYERERKRRNKERTKGSAHREAGQHSLKTLAPFFLKKEPFWEAENHDNDEYVTKDAVYALELTEFFTGLLKKQGTFSFYENYLMPWSRLFLRAEERGILLDLNRIDELEAAALTRRAEIKSQLDRVWAGAHQTYFKKLDEALWRECQEKAQAACIKLKAPTEARVAKLNARYEESYQTKRAKLPREVNLGSPVQLKWLLKDHLGLDIRGVDGETESTDKEVLELLAGQGRADVQLLLDYREQDKLVTTYFPSYKDLCSAGGTLHPNFNLDVARTGRTSSNNPNLQNQPRELHEVFIARPGYKIICKDLSAIEPAVVAFYSEDPLLVDLIRRGDDFHGYNCNAILGEEWDLKTLKKEHPTERDLAKETGLAVLYGAGFMRIYACALKRGFNLSKAECKAAVRRLRDAWPDVTKFKLNLDEHARTGAAVENIFGRRRVFVPDDVYMKAFNSLIQGTASDLLLESARRAQDEFDQIGLDAHFLGGVHDECLFEVRADQAAGADQIITRHMTSWELPTPMGAVPLRVEGKIGDKWEK